jgi:type IV pilus assembly protein PilC
MVDMIAIGEESGRLPEMLARSAKYHEERVDIFAQRLSVIIEPAILVFMGVVIGLLVTSIMMPVFSLSSAVK